MTRSFESTGPDVKIRGTPSHIAEKYLALARDAQSSGDPVLAENYLQHAEHYNRIIMAFREQQIAQGGGEMQSGNGNRPPRAFGESGSLGSDDFGEEEGDDLGSDLGSMPQPQPMRSQEGQPRFNDGPRYDDRGPRTSHEGRPQHRERHGGYDRNDRQDRGDRGGRQDRGERHDRQERFSRPERPERVERAEGFDRPQPQPAAPEQNGEAHHQPAPAPRRERAAAVPHHEQPEFLRRPVRRPRREGASASAEEGAATPTPAVEDTRD